MLTRIDQLFFDLSRRVKLRASGKDCVRFLNGQITNNVRKATSTTAVEACVLNAKGKLDAHIYLHAHDHSFVIDADPELQSVLQARLDRYVIADDVEIEDVSAQFSVFHVIGANPPVLGASVRIVAADRFGQSGFDVWCELPERERIRADLAEQFSFCDQPCAEQLRIEKAIPRWGRELTSEIIPLEANLEQRCIDYEKGCYIGQETISRMKMSGQRNKQLCGVISRTNVALVAGMRIIAGPEQKDVGWVTSATQSGDRQIALAFIKRGFNSVGSRLAAASAEGAHIPAEVVPLPFAS